MFKFSVIMAVSFAIFWAIVYPPMLILQAGTWVAWWACQPSAEPARAPSRRVKPTAAPVKPMSNVAGLLLFLGFLLLLCVNGWGCAPAPEEPCGASFDPVPELLVATELAAERWSAATGCGVRVEAGGVPVRLASDSERDGHKMAAVRSRATGEWFIGAAAGMPQWTEDTLLTHEMGHVLGCLRHQETELMASPTTLRARIDDAALSCVCEALACAAFTPELM